jgi:hypothetical protein
MNARILAQALRRRELPAGEQRTSVVLVEIRDEQGLAPTLYVMTVAMQQSTGRLVHWSRTELEPEKAREAYDQAVLDLVAVEAA